MQANLNTSSASPLMLNPPVSLNPGHVTLPLPPYLFVSITGTPQWQLNEDRLYEYLKTVVSGKNAVEPSISAWPQFAANNHLMAGNVPLTQPDKWYLGTKRWMTITKQTDWEIHLHFGFVNKPGEKHTHIQLALDTKHWLEKVAGKATHWWKFITSKPIVAGDVRIASYDTGIQIVPRQSFMKTLKSKESISSALGVSIPCIGFLVKNYQPGTDILALRPYALIALAILVTSTLLTAVIRHYFALPRFSWAVEQLKD